jgi:peptidoglycan/xylan/chitin deacetylase (PgdA/CDA1 family)
MLKVAKRGALYGLRRLGAFRRVAQSNWRNSRLCILCYHGVSIRDEHKWNPELYMSQEILRTRFQFLRANGFTVLPLEAALNRLYQGNLPPRAVSITFDDGAYDFLARAYPLLLEFGYPATLYQTTYYAYHQLPVFDVALSYLLWKGARRTLLGEKLGMAGAWHLASALDRQKCGDQVRRHAVTEGCDAARKDLLLRTVADALSLDYSTVFAGRVLHLMTPEEIRSLDPGIVDVQLHTRRHRTPMEEHLFRREIIDNRSDLIQILGRRPRLDHFCYPSGQTDPLFLCWLKEAGVRYATTGRPGLATSGSNPLLLPRVVDTCNYAPVEFEAWLAGLAAWLPTREGLASSFASGR